MYRLLLSVLLVTIVTAEEAVTERIELTMKSDEEIEITSPGYPDPAPVGSNINWYVTQEDGGQLLLECEDIRITPSEGCINGYFMIYNGRDITKRCDVSYDVKVQSVKNTMRLEFDMNWSRGAIKCKVSGANNGAAVMAAQHEPKDLEVQKIDLTLTGDQELNIESAGYPDVAPSNSKTIWYITSEIGSQIYIHCEDFRIVQINVCESYLMVFDGEQEHKNCESTSKIEIHSIKNTMRVEFAVMMGIQAVFKCQIKEGGDRLNEVPNVEPISEAESTTEIKPNLEPASVTITLYLEKNQEHRFNSPGYPEFYDGFERLLWRVRSEYKTRVVLICDDVQITESEDCSKGYFRAVNGENKEKHCKSITNLRFQSRINDLWIEFYPRNSPGRFHCKAAAVAA